MGREIRKKVIDQEVQPPDDFDEKMLEQIEKEFDQITVNGGNLRSSEDSASLDFFAADATKAGFSLDDFETSIDMGQDLLEEKKEEPPAKPPTDPELPDKHASKARLRLVRNKLLLIGITSVLLLSGIGFTLFQLFRERTPTPQIVRMVRHNINVQYYQEKFDFFILANAQREKDLISIGIEFQFPALNAFEDFQKENTIFRDVIYQFLQGERPIKNSHKYWQQIVETNLQNYLKAIFPKSGMSSIRMVYLDRL
jgi:hypothetical protein